MKAKVIELLKQTPVTQLPTPGAILVIEHDVTPLDAFKAILERNVLSAPVRGRDGTYIGFLELRDFVSFSVFLVDRFDFKSYGDIIEHGIKMFNEPLDGISVSYLARRNPIRFCQETDSLLEVAQQLAKPDVHRVPILDSHGHIVSIISQSSIVAFLQAHKDRIEGDLDEAVGTHGSAPVLTVRDTTTAYDVFKLMDVKHRTAVAVTDSQGYLLGCTSGSDLKLFAQNPRASSLKLPIQEFLSDVRASQNDIRSPTIVVGPQDTLAYVLAKFAATRVHRLFVVDANHRAQRVLSISDVIRWFLN